MKKLFKSILASILLVVTVCAFADNVLKVTVVHSLPSTGIVVGQEYPVEFTLTNVTSMQVPRTPQQDPLTIIVNTDQKTKNNLKINSNTCTGFLKSGEVCKWSAVLKPTSDGSRALDLRMNYGDSDNISVLNTKTEASYPKIMANVVDALPGTIVVGRSYPVVVTFTNNSVGNMQSIDLGTSLPENMHATESDCKNEVAKGNYCTWTGNFIPPNPGSYSFQLSYNSDGATQHNTQQAEAVKTGFTITRENPSYSGLLVGASYKIAYKLTNDTDKEATVTSINAQGAYGFKPWDQGTGDSQDSCTGKALQAGANCVWGGTLQPGAAGVYTIKPELRLRNTIIDEPLPFQRYTAGATFITSMIVDGEGLPANTQRLGSYSTTYRITNTTKQKIELNNIQRMGVDFFYDPASTCKAGMSLVPEEDAGRSDCLLKIDFSPNAIQQYILSPVIYVREPSSDQLLAQALQQQSSTALNPDIKVAYASLPIRFIKGAVQHSIVNVTNRSSKAVTVKDIINIPSNMSNINNQCQDKTLEPNKSCYWEADYTPTAVGAVNFAMGVQLTDGNTVYATPFTATVLDNTSNAFNVFRNHSFPVALMTIGKTYTNIMQYTLINKTGAQLNINSFSLLPEKPNGMEIDDSNCTNTPISVNGHCVVKITSYTPEILKEITLTPYIKYNTSSSQKLDDVQFAQIVADDNNHLGVNYNNQLAGQIKRNTGIPYKVSYTFQNDTNKKINQVEMLDLPGTFNLKRNDDDTCHDITTTASLNPGSTCIWSYDFIATRTVPLGDSKLNLKALVHFSGGISFHQPLKAQNFSVVK